MAIGQHIPLFFRLYSKLKLDILRGEIPRGAKLGTLKELSSEHGMSQSSVRKSLDLLEKENLLTRKQGWGTIVPEELGLFFFDLGKIIQSKRTYSEMNKADIGIKERDWVNPNHRIRNNMEEGADDSEQVDGKVLKIDSQITFTGRFGFKCLITFYFTRQWIGDNDINDFTPSQEILLCMSRWIMSNKLRMRETLLPLICTDETAESLGLTDGTPIFHHSVAIRDKKNRTCFYWEMASTANLFSREMELN